MLFKNYTEKNEILLEKSGKPSIEIKELPTLATEIFETLNNLNPEFKKNFFIQSLHTRNTTY